MSRLGKIARRSFLFGSAAIVGGVAFGYYAYKRPHPNPLLDDLAEGDAALTPYVLITSEGITLITPRADKGQGAYSVQAALIAEELDVDLDQVQVDPGPPAPAYYNTAVAGEGVPFPSTDYGTTAEIVRGLAGAVTKFMGLQITGGSTTVPDGWEKLRIAGAVARETLKAAAADRTGVPVGDLKTERGAVILPDGTRLPYTKLAPNAAGIEPVSDVVLRNPDQWRLIGKPMQRIDIMAKSTGTQRYGIDMEMDGLVHAAIRQNPRKSGNIIGFDASTAEAMRGVEKIIPVTNGVAVVADNTWRAFQAVNAIDVDWGPAPYPPEQAEHWQALSDALDGGEHEAEPRDDGDVDTALADGAFEAEYRAPYLAHAPLEPINATVRVTDGRVDVWAGTQIPRFTQKNVAAITGHDPEDVHVHVLMMGGSFGHRLEDDVVRRCAEIAKEMKGRPVKLTFQREEDTAQDFARPVAMARLRGAVQGGQVAALDYHVASPSLMASQMGDRQGLNIPGPDSSITQSAWDQPYGIPDYRVRGYRAAPLAPISSWRSVGASFNAFFHEGFLNELCHEAGADPLAERIRLCTHEPSRKVLEAVGEMSNWGTPTAANKGRGIAFCRSFGTSVAEVVEVSDTGSGIQIDKVWVAAEVGRIIDPVNFENLAQGGVIFGLGHAINSELTHADGMVEQQNYFDFEGLRHYQAPEIVVRGLENDPAHVHGIGEPPVPPAAPALAEAIFQVSGQRLREMPFNKAVDFI